MARDLSTRTLDGYRPPMVSIDCPRCNRHADISAEMLRQRYPNMTLGEMARRIAAARGCALAEGEHSLCSVRPVLPPVERWAILDDAKRGGWGALLYCRRHHAAMKVAAPCKDVVDLHVPTLVAMLGYDFRLERLPHRLRCPGCGTENVSVEWIVPDEPAPPGGAAAAEPIRLRPTRAAVGRKRFRVVDGGQQDEQERRKHT